jgi:hypothetical protein
MHALPDGEAEVALVLRLPWEDVARLGQEAGRLAAQLGRPVTLDEAVSSRLRSTRSAAHAKPAGEQPQAAPLTSSASVSSLPPRPPVDQARQAIERINGTA